MTGYCPDCGNTLCNCPTDYLSKKQRYLDNCREIPRDDLEQFAAELGVERDQLNDELDRVSQMFENVMGTLNVDYIDMFPDEDDE